MMKTINKGLWTVVFGLMLPMSVSWAALRPSPDILWKAGPNIEPLLEKGRPWALIEKPSQEQVSAALERLSEKISTLESDVSVFVETLEESEKQISLNTKSTQWEEQVRLEHWLKFLVDALPRESEKYKQLADSVALLAGMEFKIPKGKLAAPLRKLNERAAHLEAEIRLFSMKVEALRRKTASVEGLGSRVLWLAKELQEICADWTWQATRVKDNAQYIDRSSP